MPDIHADLSPSGAERWANCPGSVVLELGKPNDGNEHSKWGTAAHDVAERCLTSDYEAAKFRGVRIDVGPHETVECDAEMVECVQTYVDYVRQAAGPDGELHVEQRVEMDHLVPGCFGTSDAVILRPDEIHVIDLKGGRGVKVYAMDTFNDRPRINKQLGLYALGALEKFGVVYDFQRVRITIVQPRLNWVSEYDMPVADLLAFGEEMRAAAQRPAALLADPKLFTTADLNPGDKQCKFCKAKPCQAQDRMIEEITGADFEDVSQTALPPVEPAAADGITLSQKMAKVDLIEGWCKAVRGAVEAELLAGREVAGWKLVQGRKGARAWGDAADAEAQMKAMRLKTEEMYDLKLITPPAAEKLVKAEVIGPRQWKKLEVLITQAEGGKSVAPASDPRPAIVIEPAGAGFEDVSSAAEDLC